MGAPKVRVPHLHNVGSRTNWWCIFIRTQWLPFVPEFVYAHCVTHTQNATHRQTGVTQFSARHLSPAGVWVAKRNRHASPPPPRNTQHKSYIHSSDLLRILLINLFVQNWMGVWRGDWHKAHYIGLRRGGGVSKIGFVLWFYLISLIMGVRIYDVVVTFYVGRMSHQSDLIVLWRNYISS